MPLNHNEIKACVTIEHERTEGYGTASYDLHPQYVIKKPEGSEEKRRFDMKKFEIDDDGFELKPQGMVRVVSAECIEVPEDVIGYALIKNTLSNYCVLAINIGIIDPLYKGPVSSTLINFGPEPFFIRKDTAFLRLTFHRCLKATPPRPSTRMEHDEYLKKTAGEVKEYSSPTFLVLHETAEKAAGVAFEKFKTQALWVISVGGVVFALLSLFGPLGGSLLEQYAGGSLESRIERRLSESQARDIETKVQATYESHVKALEDRIAKLEATGKNK
jgi:deoxycytidine triphosphate deaminase